MWLIEPKFVGTQQDFGKVDKTCAIAGLLIDLINFQQILFNREATRIDMLWS